MIVILPAVAIATIRGARPIGAQSSPFKSGVDFVPLTVTVTDPSGKYISGLTLRDFTVFEDGIAQTLSFFGNDAIPLDVALLIDTSSSMKADLPLVQTAATGLVRRLRDCDRGTIVEIKSAASVPRPLTADRALIERTIHALSASGATALYDGLYIALKDFERERRMAMEIRRQVVILLSDGLDTHSHIGFEDVLAFSRQTGVSTYAIALRGDVARLRRDEKDDDTLQAEYTMAAMARESGGRTFFPRSARDLQGVYDSIATELEHQYELGYSPLRPGGDGTFRRIAVHLPEGMSASARTRTGYSSSSTGMGPKAGS
jgi:Ca-activated chloride channel family protein